MDIKHVLGTNPLRPAYRLTRPPTGEDPGPPGWSATTAAWSNRRRPPAPGSVSTTSHPATPSGVAPFELADRLVTAGEWLEFMADGGYRRPELWLSDGWAAVQPARPRGAAVLGARRRRLVASTPCTGRPGSTDAAGRPRQLLRGGRLRPLDGGRGCRPRRNGRWLPAASRDPRHLRWSSIPRPPAPTRAGSARCTDPPGSGRRAPTCPIPGSAPPPARWGSTTGSSWSANKPCGAAQPSPPPGHTRLSYRNFFPPGARWPMTGIRLARSD